MPPRFTAEMLAGGETLSLQMLDIVGEDFWTGGGITDGMVKKALDGASTAKLIKITMNCPGGDAMMGVAIATLLRQHSARKEVDVIGMCASVATLIAMACDEIRMGTGSQMMIHEAQCGRRGTASLLRAAAQHLDGVNESAAQTYADRMGNTRAEALALMAAETWYTAEKAVEAGLADGLMEQPKKAAAKAMASFSAHFNELGYRNAPPEVAATMSARGTQQELPITPAPGGPVKDPATGEGHANMEDTLKAFLATAGLSTAADLTARLGLLSKLEAALGKAGEAAHGVALAAVQALQELPQARARIAELDAKQVMADFEAVVTLGKDPKAPKLTPASEAALRKQFADKAITLEGARAMVEAMPTIAALKVDPKRVTPPVVEGELTHNGKSFADMNGAERAQLRKEDRAKYEALRDAHQQQS